MKIGLWLEEDAFEQDIRELLMAFYPGASFVYGGREERKKACQAEDGIGPDLDMKVEGVFLEGRSRYRLRI